MISKILNKLLIGAAFTFIFFPAMAQTTTSSLYSRFGIGEIQKRGSIPSLGMGGISNGLRNDNGYNFLNPASYSAIKLTTFEVTGNLRFTNLRTSSTQQTNYNASLNSLSMGVPLAGKWGASFGLKPLSNIGYKVTVPTTQAGVPGTVNQVYEGNGGVNQFYIGTAYEFYKGLSIGVNASYLFGKLSESKSNEFNDTLGYYNVRKTNSTAVGDFYFNYGLQYSVNLKNNIKFTAGYNGSMKTNINAKREVAAFTYKYNGSGSIIQEDTAAFPTKEKGSIILPDMHSVGFAFEKANKWLLGADVSIGQWSDFRNFGEDQNLNNTFDISIGGQYTPRYNAVGNYFRTIDYRLGMNYGQSYVNIRGEDINQYGVTAGFGLPLPRAGAKINLGIEIGQKGTTAKNLIQEEYLNVYFGVTFNDKWFIKRKYD